jgi:hypothetical protein
MHRSIVDSRRTSLLSDSNVMDTGVAFNVIVRRIVHAVNISPCSILESTSRTTIVLSDEQDMRNLPSAVKTKPVTAPTCSSNVCWSSHEPADFLKS